MIGIIGAMEEEISKLKEIMENKRNKIDGSERKDIHEVNEDYLKSEINIQFDFF